MRTMKARSWPAVANASTREEENIKGFKQFLLRGNVLDLAVAVVIAAAFGAVVTAIAARRCAFCTSVLEGAPRP